jgi:hypothetical protein
MTREQFEKEVRKQIEARKPSKYPDNHTIQTAVTICCGDLDIRSVPRCAIVAIRLAHAYPQAPQDLGQPTTPPQERQVVIEAEECVNTLIEQARDEVLGPTFVLYQTAEEVQAYVDSPSAGDILMPFCRALASATHTTVFDVAFGVLVGQPLALSAGDMSTVTYSITMPHSPTKSLSWRTLEGHTGNILQHTWEKWLPGFRQHEGHKPRQCIQTKDDQERDSALRTFVDAQKQEWKSVRGRVPDRFWVSTLQAWNTQCERWERLLWQFRTKDALRVAYHRLLSQMPQDAPERE